MSRWFFIAFIFTGCVYNDIEEPFDCSQSTLELSLASSTDASGCEIADATFTLEAAGGRAPYKFQVGSLLQSHSTFSELTGGIYTAILVDANLCSDTLLVTLQNFESDLSATGVTQPDTDCFSGNGSVLISAEGGTPPYTFSLNGSAFTAENFFEGLETEIYEAFIRDNLNCQFTLSFEIPRASTNVSWTTDIMPIINTRCAKSGCHVDGTGRVNFTTYTNVKIHSQTIKARVSSRSMPFDGPLPDDQIQLIVCWVDDGALEN